MTIHELANAIINTAIDGKFNGEQITRRGLEHYLAKMFTGDLKLGNRLVASINLPDGEWLFEVVHYNDLPDGYDFIIPETREQEERLWKSLTA